LAPENVWVEALLLCPVSACATLLSGIKCRVFKLQRVTSEHEAPVLQFELENRTYFAESISDRGDDYFEKFAERHLELMAEQEAGVNAYYVLLGDDEKIIGRFNLYELGEGTAKVGYRVGRDFSGFGVATFGLIELCHLAHKEHELRTLSATTSNENIASQKVLVKGGFVAIDTAVVAGKPGVLYELNLEGR
jgi:ribosomal-protein-alanine N-acetyltransferase